MSNSLVDQFLQYDSVDNDQELDTTYQQDKSSSSKINLEDPPKNPSYSSQQLVNKSSNVTKQSLHDLKKKYNFYDDSSSSNSSDSVNDDYEHQNEQQKIEQPVQQYSDEEESQVQEEESKVYSGEKQHQQSSLMISPIRQEVNVKQNYTNSEDKSASLSKFLRDHDHQEQLLQNENKHDDSEEEEGSIRDYQNHTSDDENDKAEQVESRLDRLISNYGTNAQQQAHFKSQEEGGSELGELYQLSENDLSYLQSTAQKEAHEQRPSHLTNESPGMKSSISRIGALLESQYPQQRNDFADSEGPSRGGYQPFDIAKANNEMTFGDLSNPSEVTYSNLQNSASQFTQSQGGRRQYQTLKHGSIIKEEINEDDVLSLEYSQMTLAQSQAYGSVPGENTNKLSRLQQMLQQKPLQPTETNQNFNSADTRLLPSNHTAQYKKLLLKVLISSLFKKKLLKTFAQWRETTVSGLYSSKLQNAATMIDKMKTFSQRFISVNSLSQIIIKNRQRRQAQALIKWVNFTSGSTNKLQITPPNQSQQHLPSYIKDLESKLLQKDQELSKYDSMFKEYSNWRTKLEQIEFKMKSDVDYWKSSCEKLQKENEKLQREAMKVSQQLMEKQKEVEAKKQTIEKLQTQQRQAQLDTVEEVLCGNCKNSLEESALFTGRLSTASHNHPHHQQNDYQTEQLIKDMSERLNDLERQVLKYRERVSYHESVEEELKKNLESQVDVVLKMEEERLLLLKENKEFIDKNRTVVLENEDYKSKISLFERELQELHVQVKEQMRAEQEEKQRMQLQESGSESDTSKVSNNKENKNIIPKKSTVIGGGKIQKPAKKAVSTLKFQPAMSKASEHHQPLAAVPNLVTTNTSDPIQKSLQTDNQLLTQELLILNRELTKHKSELRVTAESLKKSEKERQDFKKTLESKETAIEKLRKEKDELWVIVNTDKYKNIRTAEQERERLEKAKNELESNISKLKEESSCGQAKMRELETQIQELEYHREKAQEREQGRERLLEVLEEKSRKLEKEVELNEQLSSTAKKEADVLKVENQQQKKDIDWLANSAKNNKLQAEKAIADLEAYTKILRGMEKKLAETEIERETKEVELRELRQRLMYIGMQSAPTPLPGAIIGVQPVVQQHSQYQQPQPWNMKQQQQQQVTGLVSNAHLNQQQQMQWMPQQPQQQLSQMPRSGVPQPQQPPKRGFD